MCVSFSSKVANARLLIEASILYSIADFNWPLHPIHAIHSPHAYIKTTSRSCMLFSRLRKCYNVVEIFQPAGARIFSEHILNSMLRSVHFGFAFTKKSPTCLNCL